MSFHGQMVTCAAKMSGEDNFSGDAVVSNFYRSDYEDNAWMMGS